MRSFLIPGVLFPSLGVGESLTKRPWKSTNNYTSSGLIRMVATMSPSPPHYKEPSLKGAVYPAIHLLCLDSIIIVPFTAQSRFTIPSAVHPFSPRRSVH
ncbi:hypothetical protein B0I35DRAFT_278615 [Stachybotrys elegans]|uniref:Uncharacterized protein n=1 Tax=Stachybotrys elegans TaxID=80388 RepID=A0A8K0SJD2_9HYPO|nr:hypothetical protein B0I35DRAFT_278615 [Stachybotrys elegans]